MSRKSEISKHPALVAKNAVKVNVDEGNAWRDLTDDQRTYMTVYLDTMDAARACELTNRSMSWVEEQRRMSGSFEDVFRDTMHEPARLADQIAGMMLPWSMVRLRDLIEQTDNKTVQLNAIKHLHQMKGLVSDRGVPVGGQYVDTAYIQNIVTNESPR
jgi:hypothetical protein